MTRPLLRRARTAALALLALSPGVVGAAASATAATSAAPTTDGIAAYYAAHGGATGAYGASSGAETAVGDGEAQQFVGGEILWSPTTGTHGLLGPTAAKFTSFGGVAKLGFPTTEIEHSGVLDGTYDVFTDGAIFSFVNGGGTITHALTHTAHKYLVLGGYGSKFGLPLTDEYALGSRGDTQAVGSGGHLYWSASTGAHQVYGDIMDRWTDVGAPFGQLGLPTSDQVWKPATSYQTFLNGDIFTTQLYGAHVVRGSILHEWQRRHVGHVFGLGPAITDAMRSPGGYVDQEFLYGYVSVSPSGHVSS